jgi:hypothetical protein
VQQQGREGVGSSFDTAWVSKTQSADGQIGDLCRCKSSVIGRNNINSAVPSAKQQASSVQHPWLWAVRRLNKRVQQSLTVYLQIDGRGDRRCCFSPAFQVLYPKAPRGTMASVIMKSLEAR